MLTRKQRELLQFLVDRIGDDGVCPSFEEMKDAVNLKSKSGIHRLISGLEERGFIRRLPHRARALEILRKPDYLAEAPQPAAGFAPTVIQGGFGTGLPGITPPVDVPSVSLPLYGKIAAGTPISALADASRQIDVPAGLIGRGDHYALEVEGDSMIDAGILDGDTVIIQKSDTADSGSIVVALVVEDNEATLKRLRRKGNSIALEPANKAYETRIFPPDRIKVQGKLVGLLRRY